MCKILPTQTQKLSKSSSPPPPKPKPPPIIWRRSFNGQLEDEGKARGAVPQLAVTMRCNAPQQMYCLRLTNAQQMYCILKCTMHSTRVQQILHKDTKRCAMQCTNAKQMHCIFIQILCKMLCQLQYDVVSHCTRCMERVFTAVMVKLDKIFGFICVGTKQPMIFSA